MNNLIDLLVDPQTLFTAIRMMTPILYAALACLVFSKGGIDPIGVEGIMLITSLAAPLSGYFTNSVLGGLLISMLVGSIFSFLYVFITEKLIANEILTGIAFNTFATGGTVFVLYFVTGEKGSTQSLNSPLVSTIDFLGGWLGEIISGHSLLTYLSFVLVVVIFIILYKTPFGLRIRAVGENPNTAKSVGISVLNTKYITSIVAGSLIGLGGAYMSMAYVQGFTRGMVAGRGFIGMAAESMGRGNPFGVLLSSLIFGLADSLAIRLQLYNLPARLVQIIPYALTIIIITVYSATMMNRKNKRIEKGEN